MNKTKFFIPIFISVFLLSCGVPHYIKNNLTYCFNSQNTGIDTLLNNEGYYSKFKIRDTKERYTTKSQWLSIVDAMDITLIFFKDGIFAFGLFGYDRNNPNSNSSNIQYYFEELEETENNIITNIRIGAFYRGIYKIHGDTIKAQYINHPSALTNTWTAFETWYKVIDKNTIVEIAYRKLYYDRVNQNKSEMNLRIIDNEIRDTLSFIPVKIRPNSDCWLKKKKWFWCDKEDWREYKQGLKNSKKKK